jgi:hypothetical protein
MTLYEHWKALTSGNENPWHTEPSTDTQYRITVRDDTVYVDFQAASSRKDWCMAFWFWKKKVFNYRAHAGFATKAESIAKSLVHDLSFTMPSRVVFRGYSNGASLAFLFYVFFTNGLWYMFNRVELMAFATPRVFSRRTLRSLDLSYCRFIKHAGDLVTHLPPKLFNYGDVDHQIIGKARWHLPKYHADKLYADELRKLL